MGLTFPTLPLSANCWQSTFTNVISFNLLNNPVKLGFLSCFTDEATEAQTDRGSRSQAGGDLSGSVRAGPVSALSPAGPWPACPAGSSLVSPPDLALQGSLL